MYYAKKILKGKVLREICQRVTRNNNDVFRQDNFEEKKKGYKKGEFQYPSKVKPTTNR